MIIMEEKNEKSIFYCYGSSHDAFPRGMRRQLTACSYNCGSGYYGSSGCY